LGNAIDLKLQIKQAGSAGIAGFIMAVLGFMWVRFGAEIIFNKNISGAIAAVSLHNQAIFALETIILLCIICWLVFSICKRRLAAVITLFLLFPIIWTLAVCILLYGKVLPFETVSAINNRTFGMASLYGGELLIPSLLAYIYYMRRYREKISEIIILIVFYAAMDILYYTLLNGMILACAYFGECV
jgi:hypothetical protein